MHECQVEVSMMPNWRETFETWNSSPSTMRTQQSTRKETGGLQTRTLKGKDKSVPREVDTSASKDIALHCGHRRMNMQNKVESNMKKRSVPSTTKAPTTGKVARLKGMKYTPLIPGSSIGNEDDLEHDNSSHKRMSNVEVGQSAAVVQHEMGSSPQLPSAIPGHNVNATATPVTNTTFSTLQASLFRRTRAGIGMGRARVLCQRRTPKTGHGRRQSRDRERRRQYPISSYSDFEEYSDERHGCKGYKYGGRWERRNYVNNASMHRRDSGNRYKRKKGSRRPRSSSYSLYLSSEFRESKEIGANRGLRLKTFENARHAGRRRLSSWSLCTEDVSNHTYKTGKQSRRDCSSDRSFPLTRR